MSFELRDYQVSMIDAVREHFRNGRRRVLIQSPTGSGKTAMVAQMISTAASKGKTSWFIVHRRELVRQSMKAFRKIGVDFGIVAAGWPEAKRIPIQIASVQTLLKRIHYYPKPHFINWDETHHLAAGSWARIFDQNPQAYHAGMTATPSRLDGSGLDQFYDEMVEGPTVAWLIANGFLCPYKLYAPQGLNLAGIHMRMGDFIQKELAAVVDKPTITGDVIREYQTKCPGKRAVAFCVSIEHSKHVVSQFLAAGISAAHVDGETDVEERDRAIRAFESGDIKVLSNVELFGEGFDLPAIEAAILLRPTQSLGLYLQQVGRVLRPHPGKEYAVILDHAGNCERHGLPDEERHWSLKGREVAKRDGGEPTSPNVRICPKCLGAQFPGSPVCKYEGCGWVFEIESRKVEHKAGDLVEIDAETLNRQRSMQQGMAKSYEQLVAVGKARKMKRPEAWAHHIMQARQQKKLSEGQIIRQAKFEMQRPT